HTRWPRDWSSDVCSSDLIPRIAVIGNEGVGDERVPREQTPTPPRPLQVRVLEAHSGVEVGDDEPGAAGRRIPGGHGIDGTRCRGDRKSVVWGRRGAGGEG